MALQVMYLVAEVDWDIYEPRGVFESSEAAYDFVRFEETEAKRKHARSVCYNVDEVYVNPANLQAIADEDARAYEENTRE